MSTRLSAVLVGMATVWIFTAGIAEAGDQKVTLMLGGKFCDLYKGEVEAALKKVPGVTAVDLKSMKGHAIVTGEVGKMKADQLREAVNSLKGDGWHCTAEIMK
ncbi:MAG: cation transporter [Nitrospiraceae bacterium]